MSSVAALDVLRTACVRRGITLADSTHPYRGDHPGPSLTSRQRYPKTVGRVLRARRAASNPSALSAGHRRGRRTRALKKWTIKVYPAIARQLSASVSRIALAYTSRAQGDFSDCLVANTSAVIAAYHSSAEKEAIGVRPAWVLHHAGFDDLSIQGSSCSGYVTTNITSIHS
jgi:hypothetical protein